MISVIIIFAILLIIEIIFIARCGKEMKRFNKEMESLGEPEEIKIKLIDGGRIPEKKTIGAVAFDCYARLGKTCVIIEPTYRALIPLGFACGLPEGYEVQIRPRSGLSKKGIDVSLGTGDVDYTGEYMACVVNNSKEDFKVFDGDRICQLAIREVPKVALVEVNELAKTERGEKGFGSTGIN